MDFIANATGAIYAKGWTPNLQKMVAGQSRRGAARRCRPTTRARSGNTDVSDSPGPAGRSRARPCGPAAPRSASRRCDGRLALVAPAAAFYAVFVLRSSPLTLQYSFYDWNGITAATWVGLDNYLKVFTDRSCSDRSSTRSS